MVWRNRVTRTADTGTTTNSTNRKIPDSKRRFIIFILPQSRFFAFKSGVYGQLFLFVLLYPKGSKLKARVMIEGNGEVCLVVRTYPGRG